MKKIIKTILINISGFGLFFTIPLFAEPPTHTPHDFYVSLGAGENYYQLSDIKGSIQEITKSSEEPVVKTTENSLEPSATLALGYALKRYPVHLEASLSKISQLPYKSNPFFKPGFKFAGGINFDTDSTVLLLTGYLDLMMSKRPRIMPYVALGIGAASNHVKWTVFTPSGTLKDTASTRAFAWSAGIGSRFRLTDNLYADFKVQYLSLGRSTFKTAEIPDKPFGLKIDTKNISSIMTLLSLDYFFGDQSEPPPSLINDDV